MIAPVGWPVGEPPSGSFDTASKAFAFRRASRSGRRCTVVDLFEPITPNLLGLIAEAVREAVAQWEPRVFVEQVTPIADDNDDALVRIHIRYRVKATNDARNLVYPFYVIPHDAE